MKNFLFFIILVVILVIIGGLFLNEVKKEGPSKSTPITTHEYYWSETCPHCAKVNEFMENWEKKDQFDFQKYEVGTTSETSRLLLSRANTCGISQDQIGVPLIVTPQGQCIIGDEPIIGYLESLEF